MTAPERKLKGPLRGVPPEGLSWGRRCSCFDPRRRSVAGCSTSSAIPRQPGVFGLIGQQRSWLNQQTVRNSWGLIRSWQRRGCRPGTTAIEAQPEPPESQAPRPPADRSATVVAPLLGSVGSSHAPQDLAALLESVFSSEIAIPLHLPTAPVCPRSGDTHPRILHQQNRQGFLNIRQRLQHLTATEAELTAPATQNGMSEPSSAARRSRSELLWPSPQSVFSPTRASRHHRWSRLPDQHRWGMRFPA